MQTMTVGELHACNFVTYVNTMSICLSNQLLWPDRLIPLAQLTLSLQLGTLYR